MSSKSILFEWFLKDHVTVKTEAMAAENSALYFKKNKKNIYIFNCNSNLQYYCFTVFLLK